MTRQILRHKVLSMLFLSMCLFQCSFASANDDKIAGQPPAGTVRSNVDLKMQVARQ